MVLRGSAGFPTGGVCARATIGTMAVAPAAPLAAIKLRRDTLLFSKPFLLAREFARLCAPLIKNPLLGLLQQNCRRARLRHRRMQSDTTTPTSPRRHGTGFQGEFRMSLGHWLRRCMAVAVSLVLLTGCAGMASAPPRPISSITPLVGKWSGTLDQGGPREFFYLTINADQTFVASWGVSWCNGRITIANGRATYQMTPPPLEGTM